MLPENMIYTKILTDFQIGLGVTDDQPTSYA